MKHNILVIGGTGKTGSRVVENLTELGHNVRIGTRENSIRFDWDDPSTFAPALKGMDRAYIVYYPDLAVPGAKEAITALTEAALKEGLEKVVLLSGKGETEAEVCEQIVAHSGLNFTLVRASWFNQNFSKGAFRDYVLAGHIALPMPQASVPFVDTNDIADVVTEALLNDTYNSQTLTVTGPRKLTFSEIAEILSEKLGREIQYHPVSMEEFKAGLVQAGVPDSFIWLLGYLFTEVLGHSENQDVSNDVERVLNRKPITFEEYAAHAATAGAWNEEVVV